MQRPSRQKRSPPLTHGDCPPAKMYVTCISRLVCCKHTHIQKNQTEMPPLCRNPVMQADRRICICIMSPCNAPLLCASLSTPLDIKFSKHGGGFLYASVNESVCVWASVLIKDCGIPPPHCHARTMQALLQWREAKE